MATENKELMSEHTPGPWVKSNWKILDEAKQTVICKVLPWDESGCRKEDVDNAHLIAAAPELLEVAKLAIAVDSPEDMAALFNLATKAIAKAKGEL